MESELTLYCKNEAGNPEVVGTRRISDPRLDVNTRMSNENRPTFAIPGHQEIDRRRLFWRKRYLCAPISISKRDVGGASE